MTNLCSLWFKVLEIQHQIFILIFRFRKFSLTPNFVFTSPTYKIFSRTKFFILFSRLRKFSLLPNFLYYFSDSQNLLWNQIFCTAFRLKHFFQHQIFYTNFPIDQIFSNTLFSVLLFRFWNVSPIPNFVSFSTKKFLRRQILYTKKFLRHQILYTSFPTWKIFSNKKVSPTPNLVHIFSDLENFLQHKISSTSFPT